jgi:hypothetical protein
LVALDRPVEVTDYPAVVRALEEQKPLWPPGSAHGYHARTFGFLIDELVRRIDSRPIAMYWRDVFAEPLGLDIWIGLTGERKRPDRDHLRREGLDRAAPGRFLPRAGYARHAPAQNLHLTARAAFHQRDEPAGEPGALLRFVRRDWERDGFGEVLCHAGERRRVGRETLLFPRHAKADDDNTGRRARPHLRVADGFLGRAS